MNKQEAIKAIANKTGFTQVDTQKTLQALEDLAVEVLARGERLQLTGFLTLKPVPRAARKGFDPIKGEAMDIPPTVGVAAKSGEKLKKAVEDLKYEDFVK